MQQKSLAGVFHQIEHELEIMITTQVGVWNHGTLMDQAEFGETTQLATMKRRSHGFGERQIVPVHGQEQVGLSKVSVHQLAGPQVGKVVSPGQGMCLRTVIRGLSRMVIVRPGGIDRHTVLQASPLEVVTKNAMRRRASTDVAHTEKDDMKISGV